jgi:hypothetical protein
MKMDLKQIVILSVGSLALSLAGGGVIAQQANPEASSTSVPAQTKAAVVEPEPAANPVRERREQLAKQKAANVEPSGGIDPELGSIAEPDADDVAPALRVRGEGDWKTPKDEVRERVRREALERASEIERDLMSNAQDQAAQSAASGNAYIMPRLMSPNIPLVPMELLFPPEVISAGPPPVRESRGSAIIVGALNRESNTNTRIRIPAGGEGTYGSLRIKVSGCFMSHPEDTFESWAYVEVSDVGRTDRKQLAVLPQRDRTRVREATGERLLRKGWIIASSPAVTPIDHPIYDMWLINCEGDGGEGPQPQWPGGIAPLGQVEPVPPPASAPPAPAEPSTGKQTGN